MTTTHTLHDVRTLGIQARNDAEQGTVDSDSSVDRSDVIKLLVEALATEVVCVSRYRRHYSMTRGTPATRMADEFLAHSIEEQGHADRIAERIVQLGGAPDIDLASLAGRNGPVDVAGDSLIDMIEEDLVAERIAIDSYREMIRYLGDKDPTTSQMLRIILAVEEEHADELSEVLQGIPPGTDAE